MATVGILGGFGPLAGAAFYLRLVTSTRATHDQDHPGAVLVSRPDVPDRLSHLLGKGPSPARQMVAMTQTLTRAGADVIVIPSATVHAFWEDITHATHVPVINLLAAVGEEVERRQIRSLSILATSATARLHLYEPFLPEGCQVCLPDESTQELIDGVIRGIKAAQPFEALSAAVGALADSAKSQGADAVLLGCTELHLLAKQFASRGLQILDSVDVLVKAVIRQTGYHLTEGNDLHA